MPKEKTNEQALRALLKNLTPIEVALLRERILLMVDISRSSIKENPDAWYNPFVSVDHYISFFDTVEKYLGFDNQKQIQNENWKTCAGAANLQG